MGAFIVIEGIDGTGKTTVCEAVAEHLRSKGHRVVVTAEPTSEGIGAFIRSGAAGDISQRAESLLFVADRYEHTGRILDEMCDGAVVVCDRYYASTLAYQSAKLDGDSADIGWLKGLCEPFVGVPDIVILLDADPAVTMRRVDDRGDMQSKFEKAGFQEQVRRVYLVLAAEYGFRVVDASRPLEQVVGDVVDIVDEVV